MHDYQNYPLCSTQQEIWFNQIQYPELPLYNLGGYLRIEGPLEPAQFETALNQVIEDNDALRIILHEGENLPTQTFAEKVHFKLDYHDFSDKDNAHQSALSWMKQEFAQPFQLYEKPLFQFVLLKVATHRYYSFQKYHHLIVDGWAISLLVQRLATAYNQLATEPSPNPRPHSYHNFLQNEAAYLNSEKFIEAKSYWLSKYNARPEPQLTRRSATPLADPTSQLSILYLKRPFYNQLIDFAKAHQVSPFHVILGALYCYFSKITGQSDLVIGLPILNRGTAVFKQTVGLFTNVIPARFHFGFDLSFIELMRAIRRQLQRDYRHQRFPLSEIKRGLHISDHQPLFNLMLSYEKHHYDTHFNGSPAQASNFTHGFNQNALEIYIREFHEEVDVRVDFEYNLGFFDSEDIECLKARFEFLLHEILRQPKLPLRKLSIIPQAERQTRLARSKKGNQVHPTNPFIEFPKEECSIPARFEQQVKRYPNQIAVKTRQEAWTYRQLNDKANQVAHALLETCPVADERVALLFETGASMLAGMMGVLKTGKAYVPLPPDWPRGRLGYLIADSQVSAILTHEPNLSLAQTLTVPTSRLINIDQLETAKDDIHTSVSPDSMAYLLYTSGSTGQPKGVRQNHRNVLHFIRTYTNNLHVTADDKLTLLSSYSFDAAVVDIFTALLNGATLYPVNLKEASLARLSAWLIQQKITIYHSTPTIYRHWLDTLTEEETFAKIRLVVLGGEPVCQPDVERYKKHFSINCLLVNGLGSTESTFSSQYIVDQQTPITHQAVPVGYPLEETDIVLLDEAGGETEIYGEIAIKSLYLALGYWRQPVLTQAVFLPAAEGSNQRIYRTGDLGRWLPNGSLEWVGRKDFQIKLRGFRIELGEIEATLIQHEAVREAVVVLHEEEAHSRLVAYVTLAQPLDDVAGILRHWLQARLPEYMLPAHFLVLKKLPLTPNGKIDRKALPAPNWAIPAEPQAPQTEIEQLLCNLWSQILGLEVTSRQSHFFEAGGHSLLATQLVSRIRERFEIEMPLRTIFEHPLLANQAEWLEKQQRGCELPPIQPLAEGEPLVLSFAQQRLWFLAQLEGQRATYNMSAALRLSGRLDEIALQRALLALIQRHDSFRFSFPVVDGTALVQLNEVYNPLSITDLRELSEMEQASQLTEWIQTHARTPFELSTGPLLSLRLLQLAETESVLLFNLHHIISDGWSMGVLVREWSQLYSAYVQNEEPQLPKLPIQYADYAAWQRSWLEGGRLEEQLAYWREKLAGAPELLELPTDYPRPAVRRYQGQRWQSTLTPALTRGIKQLSREHEVTVFMTLLAAFQVVLFRYSGQNDLVVGSPIANRTHHQTEALVGLFVNTLVLRSQLQGEATFPTLLQSVRQTTLEAYSHQDLPFEYLVEQLNPSRSLSYSPLFQVMFVLQNAPSEALQLSGFTASFLKPEQITTKFDLTLSVVEQGDVLVCDWEYSTELFRPETVVRMSEHFRVLLEGILANPKRSLGQLPLLTEAEQQQLRAWNQTQRDYPVDQTVVDLFQAQVERTPETVAVVFEGQELSYRELNVKANQLAHHLITLGVEAETLVGIGVERSLEMVVGLLGILKAGGAYVPLDPDYPRERLQLMLEDSRVRVLVSQGHLLDRFPISAGVRVVELDGEGGSWVGYSGVNPRRQGGPGNLAYVIYTSGSTGRPKGVMVEHAAMTQHILGSKIRYQIESSDSVLQFASLNFDASIEQIFSTWCGGARLVLLSTNLLPAPVLENIIHEEQITIANWPPAYWQQFQPGVNKLNLDSLKLLILGGEALSSQLAQQTRQIFPSNIILLNAYGPTEATITATLFEVTERFQDYYPGEFTPIGRPIANTQIYIVDTNHNLTPLGVPGELCIAGVGLARGYLNRPELTAEKFIEIKVFAQSQRLYKTGDRARWLPDGNLEYLGRLDHQVKLRGFRIELGEIEAVLGQHPQVRENAVVVKEVTPTDKRLVAYWSPYSDQPIDNEALRHFVSERLPNYMVPSAWVRLEALPLTPNSKVDRQALSQLSITPSVSAEHWWVAPRTPEEALLASIWGKVLGIESIGVYDNFFELGGHSLLATQVMSRIRDQFAVELSLRELFEYPTIAQLAGRLKMASQSLPIPAISIIDRQDELPLSFAQQRLWFVDQLEEGQSRTYNMSGALRLEGALHLSALERSLTAIVNRHESLRTTFPASHGRPNQRIVEMASVKIIIKDIQGLPPTEQTEAVQRLAHQEAHTPFDLAKDSLLRVTLIKLEPIVHVLLVTMHHIISDGWSISVFIKELTILYNALVQNQPASLPPLTIQYADFAHWQRQWLKGDVLDTQMSYWKQQLADIPPVLNLPTDYPRPAVQTYQGSHQDFKITTRLTQKLVTLSQQAGVTLFMTLLAAFVTLLSRYSDQEDIIVGSPIANRNRPELEDLIGFFANTLILRTDLSGNPTFLELLERVRQITMAAYTHQDIPFDKLVEELQPVRYLGYNPIFQVFFALHNMPTERLNLVDLKVTFLKLNYETTFTDLSLQLQEVEDHLVGTFGYRTDLFETITITRLIGYFQNVLESIVVDPQQHIASLSLLTASEQQQLWSSSSLQQGNHSATDQNDDIPSQLEALSDEEVNALLDEILSYSKD